MSKIYTNQPLKLSDTITANGIALVTPVTAAEYRYWKPGNITNTPDDVWTADILDEDLGTIEYNVPEGVLDTSGKWRTQLVVTTGGLDFPCDTYIFDVYERGA